ncbi:MAG: virulence protein RhuM/Fic/DOC family protein [Bacillota bacterium]|nr:virulence protein RhuM/Fic/DOC family protein [Bacillota bacterium]
MNDKSVHFKDDEFEIDVNLDKKTVWLSQAQICELFERDQSVVSRHIKNVFKEGEVDEKSNMQKMHITNSDKPVTFYSLDVIISVGYRVKSKRGVKFRRWANKILTSYLVEGYAINISKLKNENQKLKELQGIIDMVHRVAIESESDLDEIKSLLLVVRDYESALKLLDEYDHKTLNIKNVTKTPVRKIRKDEVYVIIEEMRTEFSSELFGREKDNSVLSSIEGIYQTAFGEELYPSLEEKAANLLYFLVKNHYFIDGNKRIAAAVFIAFMKKNKLNSTEYGLKKITDETLVALTILVAESQLGEKDIMIKLIVNLIAG